jgi:hypothetical protein
MTLAQAVRGEIAKQVTKEGLKNGNVLEAEVEKQDREDCERWIEVHEVYTMLKR